MTPYACPDCGDRAWVELASNDQSKRMSFECGTCGCYWEVDDGIITVQNHAKKFI